MSFGSFNAQRQPQAMADINVTPMVDVMLVLLVIFILGAPMWTSTVQLALPQAATQPPVSTVPAATVTLAIDGAGLLYWDNQLLDPRDPSALDVRLAAAASRVPQPELALRADQDTRYAVVAQVMAAAQSHGLTKMGFVTQARKDPTSWQPHN